MARTILIADDEADVAAVLKKRLEAKGYAVLLAENGHEAVNLVHRKKVDLVIMDIMMPELDGASAGNMLRDDPTTAKIPIIFLSAILDRQESSLNIASGPNVILAKPYDPDELLGKIAELLGVSS